MEWLAAVEHLQVHARGSAGGGAVGNNAPTGLDDF